MIIGRQHKYLYVEVPQTGSSAIARELCELYGGEKVLNNHAWLSHAKRQLEEDFSDYLIVSGRRHPLDRIVSTYEKYRGRHKSHDEVGQWPGGGARHADRYAWVHRSNASFETYFTRYHRFWDAKAPRPWTHGRLVDHVIRFEHLNDDFQAMLTRLGIEPVRDLPLVNKTHLKNAGFETYYTDEIRALAAAAYGPWCEFWGYDIDFLECAIPTLNRWVFRAKMARALAV